MIQNESLSKVLYINNGYVWLIQRDRNRPIFLKWIGENMKLHSLFFKIKLFEFLRDDRI